MPIPVVCTECNHRLRVPSKYAGRRVTCTKCGAAVPVEVQPRSKAESEPPVKREPSPTFATASPLPEPQNCSDQLGVAAMALGLVSILILCLPYLGYGAIFFSATGLLLGTAALLSVLVQGLRKKILLAGSGSASVLGRNAIAYPCGGTVTCLIALLLALAPHLHWHSHW